MRTLISRYWIWYEPTRLDYQIYGEYEKEWREACWKQIFGTVPTAVGVGRCYPFQQISDQLCGLFYRMLLTVWKKETMDNMAWQRATRQATDGVYLRQQKQKPALGLPHTTRKPTPTWCTSWKERAKRLCGFGWHFTFQRRGTFCLLLFDRSDWNKWALTFSRVVFIRRVLITHSTKEHYVPPRSDVWQMITRGYMTVKQKIKG